MSVDSSKYWLIPKRRVQRALGGMMLGLALAAALHPAWLPLVAQILIVDDPLQQADAIVVLGGGTGDREVTAARLYAEGYAPVVITTGSTLPLPGMAEVTWAELSARELTRHGVPQESIIQSDDGSSTCGDAQSALAALPSGAKRVIIVTDPFHTRRAKWSFERGASGVRVIAVAANPSWFDPSAWWTDERGLIVVEQEYVKFAVTLLKGCD